MSIVELFRIENTSIVRVASLAVVCFRYCYYYVSCIVYVFINATASSTVPSSSSTRNTSP